MTLQLVTVLVKSADPIDKFLALDSELRSNGFYGEVVLKYESGKVTRALVTENIKF